MWRVLLPNFLPLLTQVRSSCFVTCPHGCSCSVSSSRLAVVEAATLMKSQRTAVRSPVADRRAARRVLVKQQAVASQTSPA